VPSKESAGGASFSSAKGTDHDGSALKKRKREDSAPGAEPKSNCDDVPNEQESIPNWFKFLACVPQEWAKKMRVESCICDLACSVVGEPRVVSQASASGEHSTWFLVKLRCTLGNQAFKYLYFKCMSVDELNVFILMNNSVSNVIDRCLALSNDFFERLQRCLGKVRIFIRLRATLNSAIYNVTNGVFSRVKWDPKIRKA
jgi:hypothetical protein